MIVSAQAISIENYMESMRRWIRVSPSRSIRRGTATASREDLEQDARVALLQVWSNPKYAEKIAAGNLGEMQAIGRRAIFFHTGNEWYKSRSRTRLSGRGKDEVHVVVVPIESLDVRSPSGHSPSTSALDRGSSLRGSQHHEALDRLLIREELDDAVSASDEAYRALLLAMNPARDACPAPLPDDEARRLFGVAKQVAQKIQAALPGDGYKNMRAAGVHHKLTRERAMEKDVIGGPESPDTQVAREVAPGAPVMPAKRSHKKIGVKAAAVKKISKSKVAPVTPSRQSADETKVASDAFKKDQAVTYKGGGRAGWLSAGSDLVVKGTVMSRGRMYVKCFATKAQRAVSLSSVLLAPKK
jgi:hypothetical protein